MAQEQKQPRRSSETEESVEATPETDVAERKEALDTDVDDLITGIKGFRLLQGYRGHPAADLEALRDLLLRLSRLADEVPEIAELDFNPVMALEPGRGCVIVDARIRAQHVTQPFDAR